MNDKKLEEKEKPQKVGMCLSGGGYRATLFHLGALWRLNEFGMLPKIDRYSSVSGGSIMAAWLGYKWASLEFDENGAAVNFEKEIVAPIRAFTCKKIDYLVMLFGLLNPFKKIGDLLSEAYQRHLFGNATLQDLPEKPEFIFDASNAQSGVLWEFSRKRMGDYRVGYVNHPKQLLAQAVAASSAFPPFLSPVILNLRESDFAKGTGSDLKTKAFRTRVVLMDGGVYDNMGLEPVIKDFDTVLVSDAGGKMQPIERPKIFWGLQVFRIISITDNQVRALRKRQVIGMYKQGERLGTYWGTFSHIADYKADGALNCPPEETLKLAKLTTRLWTYSRKNQERLINWGYAICDAAIRKHVDAALPSATDFPYAGGVGNGG